MAECAPSNHTSVCITEPGARKTSMYMQIVSGGV